MTHPHTTDLEHSKKLADACKKMQVEMPESAYYWSLATAPETVWIEDALDRHETDLSPTVQAYNLSELMRMLGENMYSLYRHSREWQIHSNSDQWDTEIAHGDTPENAACELLTELILSGKVKTLV